MRLFFLGTSFVILTACVGVSENLGPYWLLPLWPKLIGIHWKEEGTFGHYSTHNSKSSSAQQDHRQVLQFLLWTRDLIQCECKRRTGTCSFSLSIEYWGRCFRHMSILCVLVFPVNLWVFHLSLPLQAMHYFNGPGNSFFPHTVHCPGCWEAGNSAFQQLAQDQQPT